MSLSYRTYSLARGVEKVKTKTGLLVSTAVLALGSGGGLSFALLGTTHASPTPSTVVVTESSPQGWAKTEANGGTISYVASPGALGTGAVQFTTPANASYTRLKKSVNAPLSSITTLSYMTKEISAPAAASATAAVNLRLYVDTDNDGAFDDVLVYEPYYNAPVTAGWQTWQISQTTGFWWSNSNLTYNGHTTTGAGSYLTNFNLSDVLHDYPNASLVSVGLGTGDFNAPWIVQADDLVVNSTTYNFENAAPRAVVTNKDQCKGDGWKNVTDASGKTFKNQGDCVSYVATKGKNVAAGPQYVTSGATGNLTLADPTQTLIFDVRDNGASAADSGLVTYANPGQGLTYTAPVTCVNVSGNTAYFAYQIPSDAPVAANVWVIWKVVDNNSSDTAGFTTAADGPSANAVCEAGSAAVTNYAITTGDVAVQ